ncbi:siderophore-interacting protein [Nonomuraea sp. NPDC055795]
MIRVTLGLDGYVSSGAADEYFKMFFPAEGQREPVLPEVVEGRWVYPEGVPEPVLRTYTVRRFTPATGEMDVDFVVHAGGVAAPWAMRARPGDRVGVSAAHGLHRPPREASWQLVVGDATALPAIGRIVEELPAGTSATVYAMSRGARRPAMGRSSGTPAFRSSTTNSRPASVTVWRRRILHSPSRRSNTST